MRYFVVGGAGFIGSHLVDSLLDDKATEKVTVFDNLSSGRTSFVAAHAGDLRFSVEVGDAGDFDRFAVAMRGHDTVCHFAANPDIAKAVKDPTVDFWQGTLLTQNVLEAMRLNDVKRIFYASGSGVYGENPACCLTEDALLQPISPYGASKLGCEALISAYCHMFGLQGTAFRFANVVGPRQTHGVVYDFIRQLRQHPDHLDVQGDGQQLKSYLAVQDAVTAMRLPDLQDGCFDVFNVSTPDRIDVKTIAAMVLCGLGLHDATVNYSGGDRGWPGDVPKIRLCADKIIARGWRPTMGSQQAIECSITALVREGAVR